MSNPWFRMYSEFSHDPKVQMMSEAMQRRYIMFMCLRCSNALVTLQETEIAFHLRISETDMAETKALFISKEFIDKDFNLLNWEKRQFASNTSNARVAKHRALQKEKQKEAGNTDVTLPKQDSNALDTEQIQNRTDKKNTATVVATPDGVPDAVWQDFKKLRSTKKAPITETAMAGIAREAGKAGLTLAEALAMCCERGWTGFEAAWLARDSPRPAARASPKSAPEPAWRTEQRNRTMQAVPSIADRPIPAPEFFDVEAKNVTPATLG